MDDPMHESKALLGKALAPMFKRHKWKKRGLTWFKTTAETVLVFHAEKNRWGADRYSFHCAVYLKALGAESSPPFYRCPVQTTLDRLAPDAEVVERLGNCEAGEMGRRLERIVVEVETSALSWLERHSTIERLRELTAVNYEALLPSIQISREAYDYLRRQDGPA